jgi:hypothetical protein
MPFIADSGSELPGEEFVNAHRIPVKRVRNTVKRHQPAQNRKSR